MKKIKKFLLSVFVILIIVLIAVNINIFSTGKFIFSVKKYADCNSAVLAENPSLRSDYQTFEDVGYAAFNENNGIYIAEVDNGDLLIAEMYTKSGRFLYAGSYAVISREDLREAATPFAFTYLYDGFGKCNGKILFVITSDPSCLVDEDSLVAELSDNILVAIRKTLSD